MRVQACLMACVAASVHAAPLASSENTFSFSLEVQADSTQSKATIGQQMIGSFSEALELSAEDIFLSENVITQPTAKPGRRRLQATLKFTYTVRCKVNGCADIQKKYTSFKNSAVKRKKIVADVNSATGNMVTSVDLDTDKMTNKAITLASPSPDQRSLLCQEVNQMNRPSATCLGEGSKNGARVSVNTQVFQDKKGEDWIWAKTPDSLLNKGDVYMKGNLEGGDACANGGGFYGSTTVDTTATIGCFTDRFNNKECKTAESMPKGPLPVAEFDSSDAAQKGLPAAITSSNGQTKKSIKFFEFHLPKDTPRRICCAGGCVSTGVFFQQKTGVGHCDVRAIRISRPTDAAGVAKGKGKIFLSEIVVRDMTSKDVTSVATAQVGKATTLEVYPSGQLCSKAKKGVNYAGTGCVELNPNLMNDGDGNINHGVYTRNSKGTESIEIILERAMRLSSVNVMGGGPRSAYNAAADGKYVVEMFSDKAMTRKTPGSTHTGMLPFAIDKVWEGCISQESQ